MNPIVVIAMPPGADPALFGSLKKEGWELVFANSPEMLYAEVSKPACFGMLLGERFFHDPYGLMKRAKSLGQVEAVLLMAGKVSNQNNLRALEAGAMGILAEPYNPSQLVLRARQMLEKYLRLTKIDIAAIPEPTAAERAAELAKYEANVAAKMGIVAPTGAVAGGTVHSLDGKSSVDLLATVRDLSTVYPTDMAYNKGQWDPKTLPGSPGNMAVLGQAGLDDMLASVRELFTYVGTQIRSARITLLSLRGNEPWAPEKPVSAVPLISSETSFPLDQYVDIIFFPNNTVAFESKSPIYLNSPLPRTVEGRQRPAEFLISGRSEQASAVAPLLLASKHVYAVILIQFERSPSGVQKQILKDAMAFLREPNDAYRKMDLLARFYRNLKRTAA
jgi:hypothetical protein